MRNLSGINEGADIVTKDYVDNSIPTKTSDLTNDSGFVTTDEKLKTTTPGNSSKQYYPIFGNATATAETKYYSGDFRIQNYNNTLTLQLGQAKSSPVQGKLSFVSNQPNSGYTYLQSSQTIERTITLPDATGTLALTSDIPTIPTNVSAFTNDAGYIKCIYIPYGDEITPSDLTTMLADNEVICTYDIDDMLINASYIGELDESIGTAHVVGALNNSSSYFDIPFSTIPKSNGTLSVSIDFHNYNYEDSVTLNYTIGSSQSITQTVFGTSVTFSYNGGSRIQINVTATGAYWSYEANITYETQLTGHSWEFGTTINDDNTLYYYEFKASISSSSDQYVTWSAETKELGLGTDKNTWYATCSTAAATQAKIATTNSNDFILETGNMVRVKFTYAQTYNGAATLNVDGTGAKSIAIVGSTTTNRYYWTAGEVVDLVYDGTNFVMSNKGTATTTYYGLTKLSSSTSSTSTSLAATPSAVKAAYDLANSKSDFSGSYTDLTDKPNFGVLEATDDDNGNISIGYTTSYIDHLMMNQLTLKDGNTDYFVINPTENEVLVNLDTTAASGTTDGDLYTAILTLGWENEVID